MNIVKRERRRVALDKLRRDAENPRKAFDEASIAALAASLRAVGQQVDLLVIRAEGSAELYDILDGECRWRAATVAGLTDLDCIVLDARPAAAERLLIQASIDMHRKDLTALEKSDLLARIRAETGGSVGDLGGRLGISQGMATKLLALQRLAPAVRQAVDARALDTEKAYSISQEPDHGRQAELLRGAAGLSRDQLRLRVRAPAAGGGGPEGAPPAKASSSARFPLPAGWTVGVQGPDVTLANAIEALTEAVKELRKAQAQSLDVVTAQRVLRDRAKAAR